MSGFLHRNPILETKKQFKINFARVNSAMPNILKAWFQNLEVPAIKAPENRWNMDEAGIMEGQGENENGLVLGSAEKGFTQKKQPGSQSWTSFIECISATGTSLDPLVIFKGKSVQQQWFVTVLTNYKT